MNYNEACIFIAKEPTKQSHGAIMRKLMDAGYRPRKGRLLPQTIKAMRNIGRRQLKAMGEEIPIKKRKYKKRKLKASTPLEPPQADYRLLCDAIVETHTKITQVQLTMLVLIILSFMSVVAPFLPEFFK